MKREMEKYRKGALEQWAPGEFAVGGCYLSPGDKFEAYLQGSWTRAVIVMSGKRGARLRFRRHGIKHEVPVRRIPARVDVQTGFKGWHSCEAIAAAISRSSLNLTDAASAGSCRRIRPKPGCP